MDHTQETTANYEVAENRPNAAKLLSSLRQLDYSNESAICDIVDNSIDAGASIIHVDIFAEGKTNITEVQIWDNGAGMDLPTLHEAMKLGSKSDKDFDHQSNLGRYGMGMITGSLSIGEYLKVQTKQNGKILEAVQDLDYIREKDDFKIQRRVITGDEAERWKSELKSWCGSDKSGTIVTIGKIDKWFWDRLGASEKNISETLGRVFRKFLQGGDNAPRKIYVNGKPVSPIDPILDFNGKFLDEKSFTVDGETINVKLFALEDKGSQINKANKVNMANQGFYVLRNNREIAKAQTLGIFTRHNNLNLFRAEFYYPGSLDEFFNSGFTKQRIGSGDKSFSDQLEAFVNPHIHSLTKQAKKRQSDNRDKKEDFSSVEAYISQKANLLKTPSAGKQTGKATQKSKDKSNDGSSSSKQKASISSQKVKFLTESNTEFAPLYDCDMDGKITVITWNIDHPFYRDFIVPYENNKEVLNPVCFHIYSLALAELRASAESEKKTYLQELRVECSQSLRVLMGA